MKRFFIYTHPEKGYKAIKDDFLWSAFLFDNLWALYHGLFFFFCVGIMVDVIILSLIMTPSSWIISTVILTVEGNIYGNYGSSWLEAKYMKKGYEYVGTIEAKNPRNAIELYTQQKENEEARRRKIEQEREIEKAKDVEDISQNKETSEV